MRIVGNKSQPVPTGCGLPSVARHRDPPDLRRGWRRWRSPLRLPLRQCWSQDPWSPAAAPPAWVPWKETHTYTHTLWWWCPANQFSSYLLMCIWSIGDNFDFEPQCKLQWQRSVWKEGFHHLISYTCNIWQTILQLYLAVSVVHIYILMVYTCVTSLLLSDGWNKRYVPIGGKSVSIRSITHHHQQVSVLHCLCVVPPPQWLKRF